VCFILLCIAFTTEQFALDLMPDHSFPRAARTSVLWIVSALLFLSCGPVRAQNFGHQAWMSENGLPQNSVHQVLQTRNGFLWVATEGGIGRFDGNDFRIYSSRSDAAAFASDDICCLAEDASGTLWAAASSQLLRFDGTRFRYLGDSNRLNAGEIMALLPDTDGTLLVLTNTGLERVAGDQITKVTTDPYAVPSAMTKAPGGGIWLVSRNQLLSYAKGQIHLEHSLPLSPLETVLSMQVQADGTLWLRTSLKVLRLQGKTEHTWLLEKHLPGTRTESLWIGPEGLVWIGTNRGLVTISSNDKVSAGIEAIGVNSVLSVTGDREGDIWVGTEAAGLHVLRPQQFYTKPEVSDQVITSVVQAGDGTMWMGTREDGLRRYWSGKIDIPKISGKLASQIILALAPGLDGDLWVGTPDGLNHIHADEVNTWGSANGLPDDFVRSLLREDDGSIWVGTRRGLAHWKNDRVVETYTSANGLGSELIGALLRVSPNGHAASSGEGLWIATLRGLSRLRDGKITTYTKSDGLAGNVITSLAQDGAGVIWIGARDGGLTRYANGKFKAFHQTELPQEVESLVLDTAGYLWLASKRGVARAKLSNLSACLDTTPCSLPVSHYGYSNGLPSEEVSALGHPAVWRTAEGKLWFATRKGVAIVDPIHLHETSGRFPVAIERFVVDDVEQPIPGENLRISPGHASFNLEYAGLSYSAPSHISYRYRLEGLDRHWNYAGTRRTAYYTNLPPGEYRFRVEAVNTAGEWGANAAELRFRVLPPFYRQAWFYILCLALAGAAIYLAYRLRLRQLNSQFQAVLAERNRIAREIHDTLAQGFVGISIHLELVAQSLTAEDVPAAEQQIKTTQKLVREGLADARQSIWELRTIAAQDSLPTRIAKAVEAAVERGSIAKLEVSGTYRALSPEIEGEILRIAQEAIANAVRHAEAKTLLVGLRYDPDQLKMTVIDDGKGFNILDAPPAGRHFGLQGMRERAAHIGAKLNVQSASGEGTQISMSVKI
jgi:signal transduction histidine kinase/ligand-binding sensor domain-containing protein